jgi:hypothetical protein
MGHHQSLGWDSGALPTALLQHPVMRVQHLRESATRWSSCSGAAILRVDRGVVSRSSLGHREDVRLLLGPACAREVARAHA